MSATDELRRLLDERGVEYKTHGTIAGKAVTWTGSVCNWVALPDERGLAVAVYEDYLTPEQTIAATLGRGECEMGIKDNMNGSDGAGAIWWECSSCHWQIEFFHTKWLEHANFCPECGARIRKAVKR